ncbi:MAG: CPXCG motif-containing cysteine-rich protein [Kangiellaceae bacterium]|jgi:hypothetical protein|nr:CPXCG motif-containing cysteine-rich protein [Kangiellaceae bacterium]
MYELNEQSVGCPYCGEIIDVLIDQQEVGAQYIEDCQVCCRPIVFAVSEQFDGAIAVSVHTDDEVI